jgi:hypothetical protein
MFLKAKILYVHMYTNGSCPADIIPANKTHTLTHTIGVLATKHQKLSFTLTTFCFLCPHTTPTPFTIRL